MMRRGRGITVVVVLTLAVGIGANAAIFSVVDAVLLRPLPFVGADRLVNLYEQHLARGFARFPVSVHNVADWRDQATTFAGMAAYSAQSANLTGGAAPERVIFAVVSDDLFDVLGVAPMLGRAFRPDDAREAVNAVVILGHRFWRDHLGGDPAVVGRTVRLNGVGHAVVGVMPPSFQFPSPETDLWRPLPRDPRLVPGDRGRHFARAVGRLKPGVTLEQAQTELATIARRLAAAHPATNDGWDARVESLQESIVSDSRAIVFILWAAVGLVLLIACSNVANILLAQSASRTRDIAVRSALGASRARIVAQALAESLLLGLTGGAAGLLIAAWGVRWLPTLAGDAIACADAVAMNWRVVTFTAFASIATGLLVGLVPAFKASKTGVNSTLREAGRSASGGTRSRIRSLIVVGEVAVAEVLLIAAGLLVASFVNVWSRPPGFDSTGVLTFRYTLPTSGYPAREQVSQAHRLVTERLASMPEVASVGAVSVLPLAGEFENWSFSMEGRPPGDTPNASAMVRHVSPGYLETMRIPVTAGRSLDGFDRAGGEPVVVISEAMASTYWPGQNPLDRRIRFRGPADLAAITWRVVGVAGDVPASALDGAPKPTLYLAYDQWPFALPSVSVALRVGTDPMALGNRVRTEIAAVDPDLPIFDVRTLDAVRGASVARRRFATLAFGLFAGVALLLAVVGLYGAIACLVGARTREIGIRMALGARPSRIFATTIGQGVALTVAGLLVGIAMAAALTRFLGSLLYGVSGTDPSTFAAVSLLLLAVAAVAWSVPARRAARVEPLIALRQE